MTHTAKLTEHQARTLAIVEAGRANGVALASILREERAEGRLSEGIHRTVYSLEDRGLVRRTVITEERLTEAGRVYLHRTHIITATSQEK